MALKVRTGVRPQSKVAHWRWLLGSGPKVKSLATVLWRQTRGAAPERGAAPSTLGARTGGCALIEERNIN